ncbi:MAG: hypothetical protein U0805_17165 [Pirellulales bacterium]
MKVILTRRDLLRLTAVAPLSVAAGCGMLLHPERRNQPSGGGLDWGIVALDALGLLLFFFPGVIAFAVDFATGAIYLPPPGYGDGTAPSQNVQLAKVEVPKQELSRERIEQVASDHSGREVRLVAGTYQTAPLSRLDEFWGTMKRLRKRDG